MQASHIPQPYRDSLEVMDMGVNVCVDLVLWNCDSVLVDVPSSADAASDGEDSCPDMGPLRGITLLSINNC